MNLTHDSIERNIGLLIILTVLVVSVGGLLEIVPLFFQRSTTTPVEGLKPYSALRLTGRDIYIREGCFLCHSQMIRPFRAETERYGHYSVAGEFVYDHPFQWGSKRTGPDLHRVGGRYSDEWHRAHLIDPRSVVPESIMPPYAFLAENDLRTDDLRNDLTYLETKPDAINALNKIRLITQVQPGARFDYRRIPELNELMRTVRAAPCSSRP